MNYLIVEDFSGQPVTFIFPRCVDLCDMCEQLPWQILSGGNAELGVKARSQEDAALIAESLRAR
ncbi:MAG: conserved hypothetical protein [Candidatus Desulfovibrio kirbyi]|uniref:Uncharacterized protein n=1 Tax=Candidatus Desulfovibrio kirbyi TaxID=2696086 RepID=A0A6L2R7M4_9BACT|nr:MAG: conserved hypothetical protein [Candidatus Desulfovibrio kirbyi]